MAEHSIRLDDKLDVYIRSYGMRESEPLRKLREHSQKTLVNAQLAIMPEEACFLDMLVKISGVKRVLEIGVYAGYSTLALAQALPQDGQIVALERDERFPPIGRPFWEEAGVDHKIELRLCDAREEIVHILEKDGPDSFDFAFIDADKARYMHYYEHCLKLVRPGGIICVDNVLWYGRVVDDEDTTHQTAAIKEINEHIQRDDRVDMSMLSIGDGLTIVRKR